jgi:hypothetical protein
VPRFATVELFVSEFVLPNRVHKYARDRVRWCAFWWEHAEAVTRLEALWEGFEAMRLERPPALSVWLRDHFDHHMRALTDPAGVFSDCDWAMRSPDGLSRGVHRNLPPWPAAPPPPGMFAVIETAQIQPPGPAAGTTKQGTHDGGSDDGA